MSHTKTSLAHSAIAASFNQAVKSYNRANVIHREVGQRLLENLQLMQIEPQVILDLGAATGLYSKALAKYYPKTRVVAVDIAWDMLRHARRHRAWFKQQGFVCANSYQLPFQDNSVDLVFSNLMLHWCTDYEQVIQEVRRGLKPEGLFLFASLGPDSLKELRQALVASGSDISLHDFTDMHDVGDALVRQQFQGPVMEAEFITFHYPSVDKIMADLTDTGAALLLDDPEQQLKSQLPAIGDAYPIETGANKLPLTYEVIIGHGWGPKTRAPANQQQGNEVHIPLTKIPRR